MYQQQQQQQQQPQRRRVQPPQPQKKLSSQEIERKLGQQYAQALKESPQLASIYRDCEEVIQGSLNLLEHYNKISMALRSGKAGRGLAGMFS